MIWLFLTIILLWLLGMMPTYYTLFFDDTYQCYGDEHFSKLQVYAIVIFWPIATLFCMICTAYEWIVSGIDP